MNLRSEINGTNVLPLIMNFHNAVSLTKYCHMPSYLALSYKEPEGYGYSQ